MKKIILGVYLIIGVFLAYSSFMANPISKANAEERNSEKNSIGINTGIGLDANSREVENENEDSADVEEPEHAKVNDELEIEVEHGDKDVRSTSSLEKSIRDHEDELETEASSTEDKNEQEALKDHDGMRLAVHALLSSKDMMGGIGPQVSVLAQQLNSSVTSTIAAEVKIQSRGWLRRFFAGGDKENSASLAGQVNQNKETLKKLNDLISNCKSCSADLKVMLQAQLKIATDEQIRLETLAKDSEQARGLFGVLFGWLKKD